jgi:hypothetical protein
MKEGFSPLSMPEKSFGSSLQDRRARDYAQLTTAMCMGPGLCAVNEQFVSFHRSDQLNVTPIQKIAFDPELS